ncbi:M20 peptidase aminoacylase family protein [Paenibacillus eucommiae]|uniref:Amidohydrolase n=1 Tax=Paenibacillus eucommiae TaxID=1355755 RepID=A0ABS4J3K8_9BACL|nr:M20 peptidase aminoacylase family protein [Paenibacillus eucommiae]MBP1993796.1 amidohydrolase [Paenibacillus eucommiae]
MKQAIMSWLERNSGDLEQTYHHLHANAEISWEEQATTAFLQQALEQMGVASRTFDEHTGVVAEWAGETAAAGSGGGGGPVAALRSDIDALWQNVDGVWKANHSCGHDAHMTMVLFALKCLKEIGYQPPGKLVVIFQPAEETGEGARRMVQLGIVDDVDYLLGIHLRPAKEVKFGQASSAIYHGAAAFLEGSVSGRQAHASRPNDGINVIDALAAIVNAVNAVKVDPMVPASCKVTKLTVDNKSVNIIPDIGSFAIDVRAQTNQAIEDLLQKVEAAVTLAGSMNGAQVELRVGARMAAAVPNKHMEKVVGEAIVDVIGDAGFVNPTVTPGGEDFHYYPLLKPNVQATMIGLGCDLLPGLHHPQMKFNLDALRLGTAMLALSVVKLLDSKGTES